MKRETKFRGKRKDNGEWIIGNLFVPDKLVAGVYICPETTYFDFMPGFDEGDNIEDFRNKGIALGHFHEVDPESVGEFTGLKDKNGKEIYEGDIVRDQLDRKYTIEYSVDTCSFKLVKDFDCGNMLDKRGKFVLFDAMNLEVIGNVYSNPELL